MGDNRGFSSVNKDKYFQKLIFFSSTSRAGK